MNFEKTTDPEKLPEDLVEIKGLNICNSNDWLAEEHKDKSWYLIVGKELKYLPENLDTPIMIRRQEAFDLAIDIIADNPLLLFAHFKRKFNLTGGHGHGEKTDQKKG